VTQTVYRDRQQSLAHRTIVQAMCSAHKGPRRVPDTESLGDDRQKPSAFLVIAIGDDSALLLLTGDVDADARQLQRFIEEGGEPLGAAMLYRTHAWKPGDHAAVRVEPLPDRCDYRTAFEDLLRRALICFGRDPRARRPEGTPEIFIYVGPDTEENTEGGR